MCLVRIFNIDSGDTSAIQRHYEEVIEALIKAALDIEPDTNKDQKIKIFDGDKLVYGQEELENRSGNNNSSAIYLTKRSIPALSLNPQFTNKLYQLSAKSIGETVEEAKNIKVELDGKIILHSDDKGRVIVNNLSNQKSIESLNNSQLTDKVDDKSNFQLPQSSGISSKIIDNSQQKIKDSDKSFQVSGSSQVVESLKELENSPLKALLSSEIEQLQSEIKALRKESTFYQSLIERRLRQPHNTSWWQQTINNISTVFHSLNSAVKIGLQEFKTNSIHYQSAASLKKLFHIQTQPGENEYQTDNYHISRSGSLYEVKELATDKKIMQFRSTGLGIKVEKGDLETTHIKDIHSLQSSFEKNESIPDSFAPVGRKEAEYFARVERVVNALVQYAILQQKQVEIQGAFSYNWKANPHGEVVIAAKDGRGILLEKSGGKFKSNLNDRDLLHFEQVLPKFKPHQQYDNPHMSHHRKHSVDELER
ncbi:MAG: hypothetical protein ACFB02_22665 [Mastigocoleus sp.]